MALGWCCCLGLLSAGSVASLAQAAKPSLISQFEKQHPSEAWKYLNDPKYMAPVGIGLAAIACLIVWWIVATWRGRAWALGLHVALSGIDVAIGLIFGTLNASAILPICVAIYCVLRLTGNLGQPSKTAPAPRKRKQSSANQRKKRK